MVKIKEIDTVDLDFLESLVYNLRKNYFGVTNQSDFDKAINLLLMATDSYDQYD
jgi:hypothetical protein